MKATAIAIYKYINIITNVPLLELSGIVFYGRFLKIISGIGLQGKLKSIIYKCTVQYILLVWGGDKIIEVSMSCVNVQ